MRPLVEKRVGEQQFALWVAGRPGTFDDTEKAAWTFMSKLSATVSKRGDSDAVVVVESYVLPTKAPAWKVAGQSVEPGSWLVGALFAPDVWIAVSSGVAEIEIDPTSAYVRIRKAANVMKRADSRQAREDVSKSEDDFWNLNRRSDGTEADPRALRAAGIVPGARQREVAKQGLIVSGAPVSKREQAERAVIAKEAGERQKVALRQFFVDLLNSEPNTPTRWRR